MKIFKPGLVIGLAGALFLGACSQIGLGPRTTAGGAHSDHSGMSQSRAAADNQMAMAGSGGGYWAQQCNLMTGNDRLSCLDLHRNHRGPRGTT